jgi:hypothetical protein
MPTAAFPFVEVRIDTSGLQPTAQRSPGVIAIVGASTSGSAAANLPLTVDNATQAAQLFAAVDSDGVRTPTPLYRSLAIALLQDPRPSKIYGVKVGSGNYAAALAALEAADDVTFVSLAEETSVGAPAGDDPWPWWTRPRRSRPRTSPTSAPRWGACRATSAARS